MNISNNISIQAGPGASGATVIWKVYDNVRGKGISVYRIIDPLLGGYQVERRVISFAECYKKIL
jgi:hypothetical protein